MSHDSRRSATEPLRIHRRQLLQVGGVTAGGMAATALSPASGLASPNWQERWRSWLIQNGQSTPEAVDDYVPVALSNTEVEILKAAVGRIIPADDSGPGAIEAGAFIYIDRQLAGNAAASLSTYQNGLAALSTASEGGDFAALSADDQDALLTKLENGEVTGAPDGFFGLLLNQTRQGMFCDPVYGGNREFIGWDLINYPGVKLFWSEEDQALNTNPEPEHVSIEKWGGQGL